MAKPCDYPDCLNPAYFMCFICGERFCDKCAKEHSLLYGTEPGLMGKIETDKQDSKEKE